MLLLPCFGLLAFKVGKEKVMTVAALFLALSAIPLFWLLESATLMTVVGVRCIFVIAGTAFAAPYYAWAMQKVEVRQRYTILALGASLGSQLIGKPTAALCIWLYQQTNLSWAPGFYLIIFGLGAAYFVSRPKSLVTNYAKA